MSPGTAISSYVEAAAGVLIIPATLIDALLLDLTKLLSDKMIPPRSSSSISLHKAHTRLARMSLFL